MSDEASGDGESRGGYGQSRDVEWTEDDGADQGEPSGGDPDDQHSATGDPVPEPPQPEGDEEDEEDDDEDGSDGAESPPQRPR